MKTAKNHIYYLAGSASLLTFIVYLSALRNEFVEWDDSTYVLDNPFIRSLDITLIKRAFLDFYASNWHPLTWISHALDYALWGTNPLGHHLTSNILHAINTFVVVVLATRIIQAYRERAGEKGTSSFPDEQGSLIAGGVTGLLFGLHPLHVESVAWVAERKDLLCALFFLLSMTVYTKYRARAGAEIVQAISISNFIDKQYILSLGLFALALLSKSMAVTLPVCLLILDWYVFKRIQTLRTFRIALIEKLPFFALSLASSILTIFAQGRGGSIVTIELAPLSTRALVAAKALMFYLWKMIVPLNLLPFYPYPQDVSLWSFEYPAAILLVAGITTISMAIAKRNALLLSVWAYYVVTLIPVLGIVQVGNQFTADRYSYLPSLGPFLLIGLSVAWIVTNMNALDRWYRPVKYLCTAVSITLLGSLLWLTIQQTGIWKNSIDLWSSVIEREPLRAPLAYYNRGVVYARNGQVDLAIDDFFKTISLDPTDHKAYYNLGQLYGRRGLFDMAIECFTTAIDLQRDYDIAYLNRGMSYAKTGRKELALADFQTACDLGNETGCREVNRHKSL